MKFKTCAPEYFEGIRIWQTAKTPRSRSAQLSVLALLVGEGSAKLGKSFYCKYILIPVVIATAIAWSIMGGGYITKFREANNLLNMRGKNILVVGGTGGIGMRKKRMANNKFTNTIM